MANIKHLAMNDGQSVPLVGRFAKSNEIAISISMDPTGIANSVMRPNA